MLYILTPSINLHIQETFDLVFDLERPGSTKAFSLLSIPNENVINSIFENNLLTSTAEKLFTTTDEDTIVKINRLAFLTQVCCIHSPALIQNNFSFVTRFLHFCHYRSVIEMFRTFLGTEEKSRELQHFLLDEKIVDHVLNMIKDSPDEISDDPNDEQSQMISALFRLIPLIKSSEVLSDVISTAEAIQIVSKLFSHAPLTVLNAQWAAINAIITESNSNDAIQLADRFLQMLDNQDEEAFTPYMESIIQIIQKLVTFNTEFATRIIEWNIGQKLASIIEKYPKHTLAHLTITKFATQTIEVPDFAQAVLPPLYEIAQKGFEPGQPVEFRAFAFNFQKLIKEQNNQELTQFEKFDSDTIEKINELTEVVNNPYGGSLPQHPSEEDHDFGNLTPDQLMTLLRFITSSRR
ncbi:hypothetical protein TRFO_36356 [Tritrichomonas foetus]|uniref:Uncharacterized protein n=1 Tax=Tritrichomonas foetus TaxID=1144522 RepID=A0A1J4JIP6_9EUKA|nr:hypothetical protein TRFO_36356 [Tritrichomonas foetus]|eukprot:OHS97405.1 hypothetical protein TRFO_36356 [Tritrichomonas foetus]